MNCPNCNSNKYQNTVSLEYCPECDLRCDYHGSGINEIYKNLIEKQYIDRRYKEHQEQISNRNR